MEDPVVQITKLLAAAPADAVDPALLRIDARRFGSVAAIKALYHAWLSRRMGAVCTQPPGLPHLPSLDYPALQPCLMTKVFLMRLIYLPPTMCPPAALCLQ